MHRASTLVIAAALAIAACGKKQSSAPSPEQPAPAQPAEQRSLTAEECKAAGGEVVGDIGDGAIHRPDYRCPKSGQPPLGHIAADSGQPMAIEGAVCCR